MSAWLACREKAELQANGGFLSLLLRSALTPVKLLLVAKNPPFFIAHFSLVLFICCIYSLHFSPVGTKPVYVVYFLPLYPENNCVR